MATIYEDIRSAGGPIPANPQIRAALTKAGSHPIPDETWGWATLDGRTYPYLVSSLGRVLSLSRKVRTKSKTGFRWTRPRILKQYLDGLKRQYVVSLYQDGSRKPVTVQRLVALSHLPERPDGMVIVHADGDQSNNAASNLRFVTRSEATRARHAAKATSEPGGEAALPRSAVT